MLIQKWRAKPNQPRDSFLLRRRSSSVQLWLLTSICLSCGASQSSVPNSSSSNSLSSLSSPLQPLIPFVVNEGSNSASSVWHSPPPSPPSSKTTALSSTGEFVIVSDKEEGEESRPSISATTATAVAVEDEDVSSGSSSNGMKNGGEIFSTGKVAVVMDAGTNPTPPASKFSFNGQFVPSQVTLRRTLIPERSRSSSYDDDDHHHHSEEKEQTTTSTTTTTAIFTSTAIIPSPHGVGGSGIGSSSSVPMKAPRMKGGGGSSSNFSPSPNSLTTFSKSTDEISNSVSSPPSSSSSSPPSSLTEHVGGSVMEEEDEGEEGGRFGQVFKKPSNMNLLRKLWSSTRTAKLNLTHEHESILRVEPRPNAITPGRDNLHPTISITTTAVTTAAAVATATATATSTATSDNTNTKASTLFVLTSSTSLPPPIDDDDADTDSHDRSNHRSSSRADSDGGDETKVDTTKLTTTVIPQQSLSTKFPEILKGDIATLPPPSAGSGSGSASVSTEKIKLSAAELEEDEEERKKMAAAAAAISFRLRQQQSPLQKDMEVEEEEDDESRKRMENLGNKFMTVRQQEKLLRRGGEGSSVQSQMMYPEWLSSGGVYPDDNNNVTTDYYGGGPEAAEYESSAEGAGKYFPPPPPPPPNHNNNNVASNFNSLPGQLIVDPEALRASLFRQRINDEILARAVNRTAIQAAAAAASGRTAAASQGSSRNVYGYNNNGARRHNNNNNDEGMMMGAYGPASSNNLLGIGGGGGENGGSDSSHEGGGVGSENSDGGFIGGGSSSSFETSAAMSSSSLNNPTQIGIPGQPGLADVISRGRIDSVMYVYFGDKFNDYHKEEVAGRIIQAVGGVVAAIAQVLTVLGAAKCVRRATNSPTLPVHLHIGFALLISNLLLLLAVHATEPADVCASVAMILHYLHLVIGCWLFAHTVQTYRALCRHAATPNLLSPLPDAPEPDSGFGGESFVRMVKPSTLRYSIAAWTAPVPFLIMSYAINPNGYETHRYCWMSIEKGMVVSFIVPIFLLIGLNTFLVVLSLRHLLALRKLWEDASTGDVDEDTLDGKVISTGIRASAMLIPLLAIMWFLGVVALENSTSIFFQLAATVANIALSWLVMYFLGEDVWPETWCHFGKLDSNNRGVDNYNRRDSSMYGEEPGGSTPSVQPSAQLSFDNEPLLASSTNSTCSTSNGPVPSTSSTSSLILNSLTSGCSGGGGGGGGSTNRHGGKHYPPPHHQHQHHHHHGGQHPSTSSSSSSSSRWPTTNRPTWSQPGGNEVYELRHDAISTIYK